MLQIKDTGWSEKEKAVAQASLKLAREREIASLMLEVSHQANGMTTLDDLWKLHDFLSARRYDIEGKYEDEYSVLIFVLARLVKEGWLLAEELKGLEEDKLTKVTVLARM
ncbi:hypothetical protein RIF25_14230 [Thermosynechococcaceae cyanobacterium BACA0444]|uniref:Fluorescence recovery protein n=1 Tax=Pseudocalidococcus azoricus BACA0444 TaxID=2918990 RepID=A0AAE4JY96_9CYAN|nr:hypothetical protein [Pseudocalidococcus azoricus]MDS3861958.1 hypothetical protein [Pseudocalidococcus azoricus BACA0444]